MKKKNCKVRFAINYKYFSLLLLALRAVDIIYVYISCFDFTLSAFVQGFCGAVACITWVVPSSALQIAGYRFVHFAPKFAFACCIKKANQIKPPKVERVRN